MPPQIVAANAARVRKLAEEAARDPAKLRRATRIVQAAIRDGLLTVDELVDDARVSA